MDLNDFKSVNDSWGHEVGDQVLSTVARRIKDMTRADDIVARMGGDEFVVLCHGLGPTELHLTRERLEAGVSQPIGLECGELSISVSIGVSMAISSAEAETLISRSDQDMSRARNQRWIVLSPTRNNG